jgi:hypothetical protein
LHLQEMNSMTQIKSITKLSRGKLNTIIPEMKF